MKDNMFVLIVACVISAIVGFATGSESTYIEVRKQCDIANVIVLNDSAYTCFKEERK